MRLKAVFEQFQEVPDPYTCYPPEPQSPRNWEEVPEGTKSLTLVFEQMDAVSVPWIHWLVFDIPVSTVQTGVLNLPASSEKEAVTAAMGGHIIDSASLIGLCTSR